MVSLDLESMLAPHFLNDNVEAKKGLRDSKVIDVEKKQNEIQVGVGITFRFYTVKFCLIFSQAM